MILFLKLYFIPPKYGLPIADYNLNSHFQVLCRHPFEETKRAYVCPHRVEPLHQLYWSDGVVQTPNPDLKDVRDRVLTQMMSLRADMKRTLNPTPYKVSVSEKLYTFMHDLWLQNAPIGELC